MGQPAACRLLHVASWLWENFLSFEAPTLSAYISTISAAVERASGYKYTRPRLLEDYLKRLAQLPRRTGKEPRLPMPVNKALIASACADTSEDIGMRIAPLLIFTALLRSDEILASHRSPALVNKHLTLLREDVRFDPDANAYIVRLKHSKSDPAAVGPESHWMSAGDDSHCPVRNLHAYLEWYDARFSAGEPLMRRADGRFMIRADVDAMVKKHARVLGFPAGQVSVHSLRHGGAFELAENDVPWEDIVLMGRWSIEHGKVMALHYAHFSVKRARRIANALRIDGRPAGQVLMKRW